ncbi:uroporphyrinogen-III synthase [Aliiroseovarius sp. KMU-50]|uniref:Uroporphyrinogen-III synthase n=1 Tax=Aliiroseovarius salicola TaxID=3009082 RepID=A0ABT4VXF4_9RHOB|nr:uroporphyrinogen-III synthase [Aliiroseovarius sp. KMU-50]MDA5092919.1 uroporphyrinogen-III synthase [Aliiroseovarius sp. KMU-50]
MSHHASDRMPILPKLLLTRPHEGNARLLAACEAEFGEAIPSVDSPVLEIERIGDWPDLSSYRSVLLTSANAVWGDLSGLLAYCVGARTAEAARGAKAQVKAVAMDAVSLMKEQPELQGSVIYLRGAHVSQDLAAQYGCAEHITYDQRALPLTDDARALITGEDPALLPLFSPRSARLIAKDICGQGQTPGPKLRVIALSDAVAQAWQDEWSDIPDHGLVEICPAPTQVMMVGRIVASLCDA